VGEEGRGRAAPLGNRAREVAVPARPRAPGRQAAVPGCRARELVPPDSRSSRVRVREREREGGTGDGGSRDEALDEIGSGEGGEALCVCVRERERER